MKKKEFEFDTSIPMPRERFRSPEVQEIFDILQAMPVGASFVFDLMDRERIRNVMSRVRARFTTRTEKEGIRVWKTHKDLPKQP